MLKYVQGGFMWKKIRVYIVSLVILFVMLGSVLIWNKIIDKNDKKEETPIIDVSDANNVTSVDAKLGNGDVKITQSYLRNYTIHKMGTWYQSIGSIQSLKTNGDEVIFVITDGTNSITAIIDKDKCNVKKGDTVHFVGTVSIKDNNIHLTKISKEEIHYNSVTNVTITELKTNLEHLKNTYFVINGYMVTDGTQYKLFESKEEYTKDSSAGRYFLISWSKTFEYTGKQDVKIRCLLADTYKLKECSLVEQ